MGRGWPIGQRSQYITRAIFLLLDQNGSPFGGWVKVEGTACSECSPWGVGMELVKEGDNKDFTAR